MTVIPWMDAPPDEYTMLRNSDGDPCFIHKTALITNFIIGRFTYINSGTLLGGRFPIVIGAFCSISMEVYCCTYEGHQTNFVSTFPMRTVLGVDLDYPEGIEKPDGVKIGNDVWIGHQARIMPGVVLGDGCVIGARSVVTKDCEPYGIYAGVPAQLKRKRCSDAVIAELLELRWWTWPTDCLRRNARFFSANLGRLDGSLASLVVP